MKTDILIIIFVVSFYGAASYTDLGNIDCATIASSSNCTMNETCSAHCLHPCHRTPAIRICGSIVYSSNSRICKAAVHDLRISTWNASARDVLVKRIPHYDGFDGSVRFGFASVRFGTLMEQEAKMGSIIFVSPRVSEKILDVYSLHRNYMYEPNQQHTQECFIVTNGGKRKVQFNTYIAKNVKKSKDEETPLAEKIGDVTKYAITWPSELSIERSGGYQCIPDQSMLSIITSITIRKNADFTPDALTFTVNMGENFTLDMHETSSKSHTSKTLWKKDFTEIENFLPIKQSATRLDFPDLQVGASGIYTLEYASGNGRIARRGITRLIVRACPKNLFGDNCTSVCPECQNGGICHDITGVCICPPGFNGTLCEHACKPGSFGNMCNMACSKHPESDPDEARLSCKNLLICTPDPFGCSCAPGFKNISCDIACSPGEYGAGCSQHRDCHCADGNACNIYSGLCYSGCDEGWYGVTCTSSYPALSQPPHILDATETSITFSFRKWNESIDEGVGTPSSYLIVYQETNQTQQWTEGPQFLPGSINTAQKVTLKNLKMGTWYTIAVIIVDVSGKRQATLLSSIDHSTLCGKAESPPIDIETEVTEMQVNISWKLPSQTLWNCPSVSVWITHNSSEYTDEIEVHNFFYYFKTKPFTLWSITICLAACNHYPDIAICTDTFPVTSLESTPGSVRNIQCKFPEPGIANLSWKEPLEKNGTIRNYLVRYQQILWLYDCPASMNMDVKEINVTTNFAVLSLKPSSHYFATIAAFTVKKGPAEGKHIHTDMDDPVGIVQNIELYKEENYLLWSDPPCNTTYGDIAYYKIHVFGQDVWDSSEKNLNVTNPAFDLSKLIPFSHYFVKIYVANGHGVSKNSAEYNFRTKPDVPPPATELTVFSRTSTSLSFSWVPPYPPHGKFKEYLIGYVIQGGNKIVMSTFPSDVVCKDTLRKHHHCFSITDLKSNQHYNISVKAFNFEVNKGSPDAIAWAETIESTPEAPHAVYLHDRTDTTMDLEWEQPYITNGNLTNFRVNITVLKSYSTSPAHFTSVTNVTSIEARHFMFTNLNPATAYNSCVEASTKAGFGKPYCVTFNTSNAVPVVENTPLLLQQIESKIMIKIFPVSASGGPISAYFVIVDPVTIVKRPKRHISPDMLEATGCPSEAQPITIKYIAAKIYSVPADGTNFTIGDGKCENEFYNAPLKPGFTYKVGVAVLSKFGNKTKYSDIKYIRRHIIVPVLVTEKESHHVGAIFGFLIPFFIIVVLVTIFIYIKKPRWIYGNRRLKAMKMKIFAKIDDGSFSNSNEALAEGMEEGDSEIIQTESVSDELSNRIPIKQLELYVQQNLLNGAIKKEYMSLPKGQKFPYSHAKAPENKAKNRYGNLLPYDSSRVILNAIATEATSDYINANYIEGYKCPKKYIATQGPKQETVSDFWRMVWGEGSCKILMVTNLIEGGKSKCAKYWPDDPNIDLNPFTDCTVSFAEAEPYADFVIRTFHISKGQEMREVKQYHFQTWPDHGIPMYSSPVVSYLKKISLYKPDHEKPIIVHCSAGIGRTGTIILLDSMLDMGKAEGYVDLLCHLKIMREQRSNIVENLDQYIFVYNVLVETLCGIDTCIPCTEFLLKLSVLRTTTCDDSLSQLEKEFQILMKQKQDIKSTETRNALKPENQSKNRDCKILPPDRARPILIMNSHGDESNYINAVYINGYRQRDAYLVTQYPFPNTIHDFWRMVCESKSRTIVLLQRIEFIEKDSEYYWPQENNIFVYEGFKVKCQSVNEGEKISIWNFTLYPDSEIDGPPLQISLYHLHVGEMCLTDPDLILTLLDQVERRQQQLGKHIVTVQCFDGATTCGIFCAASFLCDKIKTEQDVDVFQTVKSIRTNRPEFIKNMEQYNFLYDIAETYLDKFEMYANFQ